MFQRFDNFPQYKTISRNSKNPIMKYIEQCFSTEGPWPAVGREASPGDREGHAWEKSEFLEKECEHAENTKNVLYMIFRNKP